MIRALLFDFNGVIVDDEPVHFRLFQKVLAEEGVELNQENYYQNYLGMDDFDCFSAAIRDGGKSFPKEKILELIQRKSGYYFLEAKQAEFFVPGVVEFIKKASVTHFLAVVSGALRIEIETLLAHAGIKDLFSSLVAAGEVKKGKPDPEGYEKAMTTLNRDAVASSELLLPSECLVIEDSIWGIEAARAAGMPCVAVMTSYAERDLPGAQSYFKDFTGLDPKKLFAQIK